MFCFSCGASIMNMAEICPKCGVRQHVQINYNIPPYPASGRYSQKSKTAAGILGILLGGLGVHRFYLGYTGIGILQILVTILSCGLGHFWGLIEGVLILTGSFNVDANGNYLLND